MVNFFTGKNPDTLYIENHYLLLEQWSGAEVADTSWLMFAGKIHYRQDCIHFFLWSALCKYIAVAWYFLESFFHFNERMNQTSW